MQCNIIQRLISIPPISTALPDPSEDLYQGPYSKLAKLLVDQRPYLMHIPSFVQFSHEESKPDGLLHLKPPTTKNAGIKPSSSIPLLILLHGTDETMYDSELMLQEHGESSWLEFSDQKGFILISAQSRGMWAERSHHDSWRNDSLRSLWMCSVIDPALTDARYLQMVIEDAIQICPEIDQNRIFMVGFSNGGFMAADLARIQIASAPQSPLEKFKIAGICCVMGGIEDIQLLQSLQLTKDAMPGIDDLLESCSWQHRDHQRQTYGPSGTHTSLAHTPDILLITGELDCQLPSVANAYILFNRLSAFSEFDIYHDAEHKYQSCMTERIWSFFESTPHLS